MLSLVNISVQVGRSAVGSCQVTNGISYGHVATCPTICPDEGSHNTSEVEKPAIFIATKFLNIRKNE